MHPQYNVRTLTFLGLREEGTHGGTEYLVGKVERVNAVSFRGDALHVPRSAYLKVSLGTWFVTKGLERTKPLRRGSLCSH